VIKLERAKLRKSMAECLTDHERETYMFESHDGPVTDEDVKKSNALGRFLVVHDDGSITYEGKWED